MPRDRTHPASLEASVGWSASVAAWPRVSCRWGVLLGLLVLKSIKTCSRGEVERLSIQCLSDQIPPGGARNEPDVLYTERGPCLIPMQTPIFEIRNSYQVEASRIVAARASGKLMHTSGDIPASGNEVEAAVRDVLRRRLSTRFYVGHGHIVDKHLNVSPQLDVIISDNTASPVLFEAEDGTKYFPFESVYAFGEVKTRYLSSKRYIENFCATYKNIKTQLVRQATPDNYLGNNVYLGEGITLLKKVPCRNPLFSFMLFVERGDVSDTVLTTELACATDDHLPNITCFLDGLLIL